MSVSFQDYNILMGFLTMHEPTHNISLDENFEAEDLLFFI